MKHLGTAFWLAVLGVAVLAILGGFANGRSLQPAGAASLAADGPRAATLVPREIMPLLPRSLHGARGAQGWFEPAAPFFGEAVATRPRGWAPVASPSLREGVRMAIVIRGIGEDRVLDGRFARMPYRLTFAVSAADDIGSLAVDPRSTLIDADPPVSADKVVEALRRLHALGVMTAAAGKATPAHPLIDRLAGSSALVIDGMAEARDDVYRAARAAHEPALTRDVAIDQRDEESYIAFMILQAAHVARRTGVALAVGHAYPHTYDALRRTLPLLENEGVEVVPAADLIR
jgi:hypothetical protein